MVLLISHKDTEILQVLRYLESSYKKTSLFISLIELKALK